RLSRSNDMWKKKVGYHRRSVAETAMFRISDVPHKNFAGWPSEPA
ncbi:IS5/IS1182 family transposase, partial [Aphis craccivora]